MSEPPIFCQGLTKKYDKKLAVAGIDLEVPPGICFGLLGPNGAGKTTTVEMLEGLNHPTSGTIRLFGKSWGTGHDQELRERIGVQLQQTELADKLTVEEVIRLFRSFYDEGRPVEDLLRAVALEEERAQRFHTLSGGQKQRVALATALAGAPDLLFLDEPTTGLDPRARQLLWEVVERFRDEGGTVVITTHYMEEAAALCDDIAIMDGGKIIARGSPRALIDSLGRVQFVEFETEVPLPDLDRLRRLTAVTQVDLLRGRYRLTTDRSLEALSTVISGLAGEKIEPRGLTTKIATLDDVFLALTGKELGEEDS